MGRSGPSRDTIVAALPERRGRTYAEEAGIALGRGTPAALFQLLVLSILLSARIDALVRAGAAGDFDEIRSAAAG